MTPRAITAAARLSLAAAVCFISLLATTGLELPQIATISDKANHVLAFAVVSFLADYSFPRSRFGLAKIAAVAAYGLSIEVVQYFIPWREASFLDLVADAVGIAAYALAAPLVGKFPVLRSSRLP